MLPRQETKPSFEVCFVQGCPSFAFRKLVLRTVQRLRFVSHAVINLLVG